MIDEKYDSENGCVKTIVGHVLRMTIDDDGDRTSDLTTRSAG